MMKKYASFTFDLFALIFSVTICFNDNQSDSLVKIVIKMGLIKFSIHAHILNGKSFKNMPV